MRRTSLLLIVTLLWNSALYPVASASTLPSTVADAQRAVIGLFGKLENADWRVEDRNHRKLGPRDLESGRLADFYLHPPATSSLADFVFLVHPAKISSVSARFGFAVLRRSNGQVVVRRLIELNPTEDAVTQRLHLEETAASIESQLREQASLDHHSRGLFHRFADWLVPSAFADGRQARESSSLVGVAFFSAIVLGMFTVAWAEFMSYRQFTVCTLMSGALMLLAGIFDQVLTPAPAVKTDR